MTEESIKALIEINLGPDSKSKIGETYGAALSAIEGLSFTPWNKTDATFNMTTNKSSYIIGEDILTDSGYGNLLYMSELWHTDKQGYPIEIAHSTIFNRYARGSDVTGKPVIATLFPKDKKLEVWPIPDSDYPIWTLLGMPLQLEDIPAGERLIIVWLAIKIACRGGKDDNAYMKADKEYKEWKADALAKSITRWDNRQITPPAILGNDNRSRSKLGSNRYWEITL